MPTLLSARAWAAHLLMLLAVAAAVLLGLWQLSVWSGDRAAAARNLTHARPVPLASVMGGDSPFPGGSLGRPVTFSGTWLPSGTVYVSGRQHHGTRGFWVVSPVLIGRSAMPVVRGWSPTAHAALPHGSVSITGWLQAGEGSGEADLNPRDDVITSMRIASLTQHVHADLYSAYVVSRDASDGTAGLARVSAPVGPSVSGATGLRNLLYATQWWFFGGFAIYVWIRWCRDQLDAPEVAAAEATRSGA
ncbi:SURF1 family protein [Nocardioides terrisoli]|uniref:SURF1 family protein n=1 Tax=Nocardioides terrisoli TaxID=3388267 RepID=UPI00287B6644|nr:SURF1 family protein [Nocardioides marmorisolisilvae]